MKDFDIYEEITSRILQEMKKGKLPWRTPWSNPFGMVSHVTGKRYSLLNSLLLGLNDTIEEHSEYLTLMQCNAEGGRIKKGAKGSIVVFWKMHHKTTDEIDPKTGENVVRKIPCLRYYRLFEVSQCDGITRKYGNKDKVIQSPIEECERIVNTYFDREACSLIKDFPADEACYVPADDVVKVPMLEQYDNVNNYYATLFHEMAHSTGHNSRLDRLANNFTDLHEYSKEELVAELASSELCHLTGTYNENVFENSAAYVQSWSKFIKSDPKVFVAASSRAEDAVNYILYGDATRV